MDHVPGDLVTCVSRDSVYFIIVSHYWISTSICLNDNLVNKALHYDYKGSFKQGCLISGLCSF